MLDNEEDDIADDIRKALAGDDGAADVPDPAPAAANEADDGEDEEAKTPAEGEEKPSDGRVRGPDGKFVAKATETGQDTPVTTETATEAPQEPIRVPPGWSPAAKAKFAGLDPDIQNEILKREKDFSVGLQDRTNALKRYEPLEQVLAPHRQKWAVAGVDEATAVKQLLAASDWLERDPATAIAYLAKQYGLGALPTGTAQPQAQPESNGQNPQLTALQQELQDLKQQIASQSEAGLLSQIEAFKSDPKNLYFENVREDMAALINAGRAKTLEEAYDKACWMRDDIRPLLQTAQVTKDPANVQKAKAAAVSITGSPAQARVPQTNATSSIEDDIRAAILETQGQA
jgi:hypothetical protein